MSAEVPRFESYQSLVWKTEDLTIANCRNQEIDDFSLLRCIMAALQAYEDGVSQEAIAEAVQEGMTGGKTLYQNTQTGGETIDYWRCVRADARAFWDRRSSADE